MSTQREFLSIPNATKADSIPERRVVMMGGGKSLQPSAVAAFCGAVVNAAFDGDLEGQEWFALGVAACLDAVSRGTLDARAGDPVAFVGLMRAEVDDVSGAPNAITDVMKLVSARARGGACGGDAVSHE